jgi:hypothetical protein
MIGFIGTSSITITTNYNSLQWMAALDSLQSLLDYGRLLHCDEWRSITCDWTGLNSRMTAPSYSFGLTECHNVLQVLCYSLSVCNRCPAIDYSAAIRYSGNMLTEPLPSNGHNRLVTETCASEQLASNGLFRLSGVMSQYLCTESFCL